MRDETTASSKNEYRIVSHDDSHELTYVVEHAKSERMVERVAEEQSFFSSSSSEKSRALVVAETSDKETLWLCYRFSGETNPRCYKAIWNDNPGVVGSLIRDKVACEGIDNCIEAPFVQATTLSTTSPQSPNHPRPQSQTPEPSQAQLTPPQPVDQPALKVKDGIPNRLDAAEIEAAISKVRSQIDRCGTLIGEKAKVAVRIRISKSGLIRGMTPKGGSKILQDCVVGALRQAEFGESQKSFAVTYPFEFK
jgi:hypothetical protein